MRFRASRREARFLRMRARSRCRFCGRGVRVARRVRGKRSARQIRLFDAIDGEPLRCYMTHHQGMTMAAITNVLCDGAITEELGTRPEIARVRKFCFRNANTRINRKKSNADRLPAKKKRIRIPCPESNAKGLLPSGLTARTMPQLPKTAWATRDSAKRRYIENRVFV